LREIRELGFGQSTLLEALALAFEYFDGVAARLVLDNMATAVLGRIGPNGKHIWNERFERFVAHYSTEPFACFTDGGSLIGNGGVVPKSAMR